MESSLHERSMREACDGASIITPVWNSTSCAAWGWKSVGTQRVLLVRRQHQGVIGCTAGVTRIEFKRGGCHAWTRSARWEISHRGAAPHRLGTAPRQPSLTNGLPCAQVQNVVQFAVPAGEFTAVRLATPSFCLCLRDTLPFTSTTKSTSSLLPGLTPLLPGLTRALTTRSPAKVLSRIPWRL